MVVWINDDAENVHVSGEDTRNPNTQKANGASIAAGMVGDIMQVSFDEFRSIFLVSFRKQNHKNKERLKQGPAIRNARSFQETTRILIANHGSEILSKLNGVSSIPVPFRTLQKYIFFNLNFF